MGYSEFLQWIAYLNAEPVGGARGDTQAAMICATIANSNRRKGTKARKVGDFIPDFWSDKTRPESLMRKLRRLEKEADDDGARDTGGRSDGEDRRLQEQAE